MGNDDSQASTLIEVYRALPMGCYFDDQVISSAVYHPIALPDPVKKYTDTRYFPSSHNNHVKRG